MSDDTKTTETKTAGTKTAGTKTTGEAVEVETADNEEAVAPQPEPDPNAVSITLNGRTVEARKGEMLIAAAERHGEYIPRFCYHSRLSSVGMCRQCMVEVDTGRGPGLQPSCMVPVAPDMVVDTQNETVQRAQQGIIELLLANHPLDCPVCDKGGECPLQDQAFSHGPGESRFVEEKRHYEKPIPISDHILLDRERCILCDRCTRFADEVAGDKLIHFIDRGNFTQVNTFPDEPFASYFSGNIAQICPVGALTAKPYRFKARPWDLEQAESTCTTCSVGCRVSVHSSRDEVLRVQGVDADSVNWGWLCDKGRFNFESLNSDDRVVDPLVRTDDGLVQTQWSSAMAIAGQLLSEASTVAVLGGARSTNEGAYAWGRFADLVGAGYRDAQLGDGLPAELLGMPRATIDEAASADTVVLLGPDLKEELPILYLRLRHAAERGTTKLIELSPAESGLTRYAMHSERYMPGAFSDVAGKLFRKRAITKQLKSGSVVVVAGRGNLAESAQAAAANLCEAMSMLPDAKVLPALRRGNVVGALQLGLAPSDADHDAIAALEAAASGKIDVLLLVGADPLSDVPDLDLARRGLAGARRVISIDTHLSPSTAQADIVLPTTAWAERSGTTTNLEGRVSAVRRKVTAAGTARDDWAIASEFALLLDEDFGWGSVDSVTAEIAAQVPAYSAIADASGTEGTVCVVNVGELAVDQTDDTTPNSYDYRLVVSRTMYDAGVASVTSPALADLAGGSRIEIHPLDLDRLDANDGDDVSVTGPNGSTVMPVKANSLVQRGTAWAPFNQPGTGSIADVLDSSSNTNDVKIETIGGSS